MATVQLSNLDAKLAYLALQYHLARPGSELDPATGRPVEHGLTKVAEALEPQLRQAVVTLEFSQAQHQRLISAIAGTINELKTYPLLGGGQSVVPGFDAALKQLFPEVAEEPGEATQLAGHLVALRRRLERAVPGAPASEGTQPSGRRWWRFWDRGES